VHDLFDMPVPVHKQKIAITGVGRTLADMDAIAAAIVLDAQTLAVQWIVEKVRVLLYMEQNLDVGKSPEADVRVRCCGRTKDDAAEHQRTRCKLLQHDIFERENMAGRQPPAAILFSRGGVRSIGRRPRAFLSPRWTSVTMINV
jgi:hypothetical protein